MRAFALCLLLSLSSFPLFAAAPVPTVTAVAPSLGINSGGTTVQITGTGFTGATAVKFNGVSVVVGGFTVISDTTINAVSPNVGLTTGAVSVDVTTPGGTNVGNALFTYTSPNQDVQIHVTVTVNKQANIQWGAGTGSDDTPAARALSVAPFVWTVKDPEFGAANQTQCNVTYSSNDTTNNKTITVSNNSKTNNIETITAITSDSLNWMAAAGPGPNQFKVQATLGGVGPVTLSTASAMTLTNNLLVDLGTGQEQALVIQFSTPTSISAGIAGVQQTITVSLIATAN